MSLRWGHLLSFPLPSGLTRFLLQDMESPLVYLLLLHPVLEVACVLPGSYQSHRTEFETQVLVLAHTVLGVQDLPKDVFWVLSISLTEKMTHYFMEFTYLCELGINKFLWASPRLVDRKLTSRTYDRRDFLEYWGQ